MYKLKKSQFTNSIFPNKAEWGVLYTIVSGNFWGHTVIRVHHENESYIRILSLDNPRLTLEFLKGNYSGPQHLVPFSEGQSLTLTQE